MGCGSSAAPKQGVHAPVLNDAPPVPVEAEKAPAPVAASPERTAASSSQKAEAEKSESDRPRKDEKSSTASKDDDRPETAGTAAPATSSSTREAANQDGAGASEVSSPFSPSAVPVTFQVTMCRDSEDQKWGLAWHRKGFNEKRERVVEHVRKDMLAGAYNKEQTAAGLPHMVIKPGDRLVSANGKLENDEMTEEMKKKDVILVFQRHVPENEASNYPLVRSGSAVRSEAPPQPADESTLEVPEQVAAQKAEQTEEQLAKEDLKPEPQQAPEPEPCEETAAAAPAALPQQDAGSTSAAEATTAAAAEALPQQDGGSTSAAEATAAAAAAAAAAAEALAQERSEETSAPMREEAATVADSQAAPETAVSQSDIAAASADAGSQAPAAVEPVVQNQPESCAAPPATSTTVEKDEALANVCPESPQNMGGVLSASLGTEAAIVAVSQICVAAANDAIDADMAEEASMSLAQQTREPTATETEPQEERRESVEVREPVLLAEDSLQEATVSAMSIDTSGGLADFMTFSAVKAALDVEGCSSAGLGAADVRRRSEDASPLEDNRAWLSDRQLGEEEKERLVQEELEKARLEQEQFEECFEELLRSEEDAKESMAAEGAQLQAAEQELAQLARVQEEIADAEKQVPKSSAELQALEAERKEVDELVREDLQKEEVAKEQMEADNSSLQEMSKMQADLQAEEAALRQQASASKDALPPQPLDERLPNGAEDVPTTQNEETEKPIVPFRKVLEDAEAVPPDVEPETSVAPEQQAVSMEVESVPGPPASDSIDLVSLLDQRGKAEPEQQQACLAKLEKALSEGAMSRCPTGSETPLLRAAHLKDKDAVALLLKWRADPNVPDRKGVVPLHMATCAGAEDVVDLLIQAGAEVNRPDRHGQTPLFFAPTVSMCERLCQANADINARNFKGQSALHLAAFAGFNDVVAWLLERMQPKLIDAQDKHGRSAVYCASRDPDLSGTVSLMVSKGADINRPRRMKSSSQWAVFTLGGVDELGEHQLLKHTSG